MRALCLPTPVREEAYATPWGPGRVVTALDLPVLVDLPTGGAELREGGRPASHWARLLARYFAGEAVDFCLDIERYADVAGLSEFERAVYRALRSVPRGEAVSYRDVAVAAGYPNAYRAVGSTMARNQLPVILPCHRVVRNDGSLGNYGDDPAWKRRLLEFEGVRVRGGRIA